MDAWLSWVAARSPDYVVKKLDVWKILGTLLLNTEAKVVSDLEPVRTGNMLIALTGPSGSIKSWALSTMRFATPTLSMKAGTPDYLLTSIANRGVGVIYEPEIGSVLKMAEHRGGYMRTWGDLVDKIYDLDVLEAGRKTSESVFVEPRSYYVSVCTAGTPKDYTGMFTIWPGLKRRFLILDMEEVAPPRVWKPTSEGAEALAKLHAIEKALCGRMVVVRVENPDVLNRFAETMPGDPSIRRKCFEYLVKMFYGLVLDFSLADIVGNVGSFLYSPSRGGISINNIELQQQSMNIYTTDDTSSIIDMFSSMVEGMGIERVSVVSVDCRQFLTDIKLLSALLYRQLPTLPTLEAPVREYAEFMQDVNDLLKPTGYITLRDVCRKRNWTSQKALSYLESMVQAGYVVVRRSSRSIYILRPSLRVCGTCRHFGTAACKYDPKREGLVDVLQSEWAMDKCYEPFTGGE
jgi:hypothetical protein